MRSLAILILLSSALVAQTEDILAREAARNKRWATLSIIAEKAATDAANTRAKIESRLTDRKIQLQKLTDLYDGGNRPDRRDVLEAIETSREEELRVERNLSAMQERVESAQSRLQEALKETADWEVRIDNLIKDAPEQEQESWDRIRTERNRISREWKDATAVVVTDLGVAARHLSRIGDLLVRMRTTHEVKNIWMRGTDQLTWESVEKAINDVPDLMNWVGHSVDSVSGYISSEQTRMGLLRWGGASLIAIIVALWLGVRLRRYSSQLEATGMEEPQQRVFRTSARLLRRGLHFALLYIVPWSASVILPGLSSDASKFLERMGFLFALLYVVWSFYWELLRPHAADHAIVEPDAKTRRKVAIAVYFILGWSLLLQPLRIGIKIFGDKYGSAHQIVSALLLFGIAVALSGVIFRKRVMDQLLPVGDSGWARFTRGSVSIARPFLVLLTPTLVVLKLLQYDILADLVTRFSLALLASLAINLIVYQVAKVVILHWALKKYGEDADKSDTAGGATRAALIFGARLLCAWFVVVLGLQFADSSFLDLRVIFDAPLPFTSGDEPATWGELLAAIVLFTVVVVGTRHLRSILRYQVLARVGLDRATSYTITKLVGYAVLGGGVMLAIDLVFDLSDMKTIIAGLAVGVGFGLQEIVANVVSGVMLLFERPVRIGDTIEVGENRGLIRQINMRATTVQTLDNVFIHVPNRELMSQTVVNYGYDDPRIRLRIPVGVSYQTDPHAVRDLLLDVASKCERVLKYPSPQVQFVEFGESSLNFELQPWIQRPEQGRRIVSELNFAIFDALKEAGIEIPFPQRDLHIKTGDVQPIEPPRED